MNAKDHHDFATHPQWFDVRPLDAAVSPEIVAAMPLMTPDQRARIAQIIANPPVTIARKPVPFVLPIKGSAL